MDEIYVLLGYDVASLGIGFPTFRKNVLVFSSNVQARLVTCLEAQSLPLDGLYGYATRYKQEGGSMEKKPTRCHFALSFILV